MDNIHEFAENISKNIRKMIHDANNSLFVAKGFVEEVVEELEDGIESDNVSSESVTEAKEMLDTAFKHLGKLENIISTLQTYVKVDIFTDIEKP